MAGPIVFQQQAAAAVQRPPNELTAAATGAVFVDEGGRALGAHDVANVLGIPVLATVSLRASTARAIDAGVLATRLPDAMARPAREVLRRIGGLDHERAA